MTGATPPQCVFQNVLLFFLFFLLLLLLVVAVVAVVVADTGNRASSWLGRPNLMGKYHTQTLPTKFETGFAHQKVHLPGHNRCINWTRRYLGTGYRLLHQPEM